MNLSIFVRRMVLAVLVPLLIFAVAEILLRVASYGTDPRFVLRADDPDGAYFHENPDIGRLWFEPGLTRMPVPFRVPMFKTGIRVVVVGESAAMGDPEPAFGLVPTLEVVLRHVFPDKEIEVINAAMTAIDSSVITHIVPGLAPLVPDFVVVYMGNNEVVGPFGPQPDLSDPLFLDPRWTRVTLWVRSLRLGQWLRNTWLSFATPHGKSWGGLAQFHERSIDPDSPTLAALHHRFEINTAVITDAIVNMGATPVICTMATALNWPPFAPARFTARADEVAAEEAGQWRQAADIYRAIIANEPTFAEAWFRLGRALMALGEFPDSIHAFRLSRDLDTLRFRVDSTMNQTLKRVRDDVLNVDVEAELNRYWLHADRYFWDHVHLKPDGNYLAAAAIANMVIPALEQKIGQTAREVPGAEQVRRTLLYTEWDRMVIASLMHERFLQSPYIHMALYERMIGERTEELRNMLSRTNRELLEKVRDRLRAEVQQHPDNYQLLNRLGKIYEESGEMDLAFEVYETMVKRWPHVRSVRHSHGQGLVRAGQLDEGLRELEKGEIPGTTRPQWIALLEAASLEAEARRFDSAMALMARAMAIYPEGAKLWYNRGIIYNRSGQLDDAEKNYLKALQLEPTMAEAYNNLGVIALRQGRVDDARRHFQQAVEHQPYHISALRNLVMVNMQRGKWEGSETYIRRLALIDPDPGSGKK